MKEPQKDRNNSGAYSLIITTTNDRDEAKRIAELLVKKGAAACVSISSPVNSIYKWEGRIEVENEFMLFVKTVKQNYSIIETLIKENHSYEVPEIITLPIENGEENYLNWLAGNSQIEKS